MSFTEYATKGQLAILENGIFLVDGCRPTPNLTGDRLEIKTGDIALGWPMRPVHLNSLWLAYARANDRLEDAINNAAKEVIAQPLKLVQESQINFALNLDSNYIKAVRTILFEFGLYFVERKASEIMGALKNREDTKTDALLSHLESKLGTIDIVSSPEKLRSLVENFIAVLKDRPLEQFDTTVRKELKSQLARKDAEGVFWDGRKSVRLQRCNGAADANAEKTIYINGVAYTATTKIGQGVLEMDYVFSTYETQFVRKQSIGRAEKRLDQIGANMSQRELGILVMALKAGNNDVTLDLGKWGLVLKPDKITVYLNVPPYALRDWARPLPASYHAFPKERVAITIIKDKSGEFLQDHCTAPYLLGEGWSPFISDGHGKDRNICMGTFNDHHATTLHGLSFPQWLAKYLSEAYKIVTSGYNKRSDHWGYVGNAGLEMFPKKTKEELETLGIPVTNED